MPKRNQLTSIVNYRKAEAVSLAKLDRKDLLILNELLSNPDATSSSISKSLKIALSTVQRRRSVLEHSTLIKKSYELDAKQFGWRTADLLISVVKGDCVEIANWLLTESFGMELAADISKNITKSNSNKKNGPRVIETSLRIGDPVINVVARIIYRSSDELFHIMQELRKMPHIERVEWSEIVKVVGRNSASVLTNSILKNG